MQLIGNAVSNAHMHEIICRWPTNADVYLVSAMSAIDITPENLTLPQVETELFALSDHDLDVWVHSRLKGYPPHELDLELKEGTGPCLKPGVAYNIPAGHLEPTLYQLQKQCEQGYLVEAQYEHGMWVSPAFGKSKGHGVCWPGTNILKFRILADLRKLNAGGSTFILVKVRA